MKEIIIPIICAIVSAIISSLITAFVSISIQKRKEEREDKINKKREQQTIFKQRPEFSIEEYKNYLDRPGYGIKQKCDIGVFISFIINKTKEGLVSLNYKEDDFIKENWCCVIYKLKNSGKTDIKFVDIVSNHKKVIAVFNSEKVEDCLNKGYINYSEPLDRIVKVDEEIVVKICFNKDRVLHNLLSANLCLGMIDENDHYWMQPLFVPDKKIYNSYQVSRKEYIERTD